MNPILLQQMNSYLELSALRLYLDSIGSSYNEMLESLPNMPQAELDEFMDGYQAFYKALQEKVLDASKEDLKNS